MILCQKADFKELTKREKKYNVFIRYKHVYFHNKKEIPKNNRKIKKKTEKKIYIFLVLLWLKWSLGLKMPMKSIEQKIE
jgi:hypothetical protein